MTRIYLSRLHYPVTTLGPGHRIGIWFQGCSLRCRGCISADTWAKGKGETSVAAVIDHIKPWLPEAHGVTISGGEPFEQPEALQCLLEAIRYNFSGDVLVYSGFELDDIQSWIDKFEDNYVDALITGRYKHEVPQTLPLRGSDNQIIHKLTPRGKQLYSSYDLKQDTRNTLDIMFDEDGSVWLAGIPGRGDFEKLQTTLQTAGHSIYHTGDQSLTKKGR